MHIDPQSAMAVTGYAIFFGLLLLIRVLAR